MLRELAVKLGSATERVFVRRAGFVCGARARSRERNSERTCWRGCAANRESSRWAKSIIARRDSLSKREKGLARSRLITSMAGSGSEGGAMRVEEFCVVYVTVPNEAVATSLASALVDERLAACVNAIPSVQSTYLWEGKVQTDTEQLLMIKTRRTLFGKLQTRVKALHPYDLPEVIAVPLVNGLPGYLEWIANSTSSEMSA